MVQSDEWRGTRFSGPVDFFLRASKFSIRYAFSKTVRTIAPTTGYQYIDGIPVNRRKFGDSLFFVDLPDHDNLEAGLILLISKYVTHGERVVVIGAHFGVSTVEAAEAAGPSGKVITFEATHAGVEACRRTVRLNNISNVTVKQRVVGSEGALKGNSIRGARRLDPADIPPCDTLVIDCDSCEFGLLKEMEPNPERIIVEHHGQDPTPDGKLSFEFDRERLTELLNAKGYEIIDEIVNSRVKTGEVDDTIGRFVATRE